MFGGWRRLAVSGGWLVAVGGWQLAAADGWQLVVSVGWRLAVGSWRLVVVGGWRLVAVGDWRLVDLGGCPFFLGQPCTCEPRGVYSPASADTLRIHSPPDREIRRVLPITTTDDVGGVATQG